MYSGTRVLKVDVLHGFPIVGISVDVHAYVWGKGNTTLVVDLVSRRGGSREAVTLEDRTTDPPLALYVDPPSQPSYHEPPKGVISTVDTSKAIMHARTRASVPTGDPGPGLALVNVSKVLQQCETANGFSKRDFYAVVHYYGKVETMYLTIATSCIVCIDPLFNIILPYSIFI